MAELALDRMVKVERYQSKSNFNFDWLDDTDWTDCEIKGSSEATIMGNLSRWKEHPLRLMARHKKSLLQHPVCLAFIQKRWSLAKWFYFVTLFLYVFFQSMVTSYMMTTSPPWTVNKTQCTVENIHKSTYENYAMGLIWFCCFTGLVVEGFQIWTTKWSYINAVSILDWFCYISALLITLDLTDCKIRTAWQWQLGAITVLAIWINMLLMFRLLPTLGVYVTMFVQISRTFAKFFVIFFLFLLAFSLSFYILLQTKVTDSAAGIWKSVIGTWVRMLGEYGYAEDYHQNNIVQLYPTAGYIIFVIFLVFGAVIIMNLLVGLAVGDVTTLQEEAKQINLAVLIDYALDIEEVIPSRWKEGHLEKWAEIKAYRYRQDKMTGWNWLCRVMGHCLIDYQLISEHIHREATKVFQKDNHTSDDTQEMIANIQKTLESQGKMIANNQKTLESQGKIIANIEKKLA